MSKRFARTASAFSIALISALTVTALPASASDPQSRPNPAPSAHYVVATSTAAQDRSGYEQSLYHGKYYFADQEAFRECVMKRESHHNYRAANRSSSARGAYQFLDNNWRDGLVYMMLRESRQSNHGLEDRLKALFDKPISEWNRYFQDRAFFTALNYEGKWSGKDHWNATVPGTSCGTRNTAQVQSVSYRDKGQKQTSDEYRRAMSKAANDLHGYELSLYRGKYYNAGQESWRKCVMWRESNYNYNLIGAGYNWPYHGAYQFHNVNWKRGLIIMMAKESKQTKDGLNGEARKLKHKNINQWNRYWQDRALFTALNYNGPYSGAHHWAMTNYGC